MPEQSPRLDLFKWTCFGAAILFAGALFWMLSDLKTKLTASVDRARTTIEDAKETIAVVNGQLPLILAETKQSTQTLARLADDVELMKSIAGVNDQSNNRGVRSLALYAEELQSILAEHTEGQASVILIEEVFGSDLKEVEPTEEFLVGLNKEMLLTILPFAKSKQEILYRATYSGPPRRKPYFIKFPDQEPINLQEFLKSKHPASAELPQFEP